jgi:hypothetical protein
MIRIHITRVASINKPSYLLGKVEINGVYVLEDIEYIRNNPSGAKRALKQRLEQEVKCGKKRD